MKEVTDKIIFIFVVLMLAVFLPVLLCAIFIGNNMDYGEGLKLVTLCSNPVLAVVALAGIAACIILFRRWLKEIGKKADMIANIVFAALFVICYFVSVKIAREIAFKLPWDISVVRGVAYFIARKEKLGYYYYLSMNTNNIPISYILGILYRKVTEAGNYPYVPEFVWIQVNCALISIGGFFSCLTVKKLTRRLAPAAVTFLLYTVLVEASPWMMAAYTDTYGITFPIMCIYFYLCYLDAGNIWQRYVFILLSLVSGGIGGFIKPSAYIVVVAVIGAEFIFFLRDCRGTWHFFLVQVLLLFLMFGVVKTCRARIIEEIGLDFNQEIEMGWQHYFMMGLNEETTGSYSTGDAGFITNYQDSKSDRCKAELAEAEDRLREKGFWGSIYFWLRKMVMVFNDGTFGWRGEVWIEEYYPPELASNTTLTEFFRNIYWPEGADEVKYNTFCQFVWIFCILCIPGICFLPKEKREKYVILTVAFLGIFFYQMLFEARARYLFIFLPLLIAISGCGLQQYACLAESMLKRIKAEKNQRKEDAVEGKPDLEIRFTFRSGMEGRI